MKKILLNNIHLIVYMIIHLLSIIFLIDKLLSVALGILPFSPSTLPFLLFPPIFATLKALLAFLEVLSRTQQLYRHLLHSMMAGLLHFSLLSAPDLSLSVSLLVRIFSRRWICSVPLFYVLYFFLFLFVHFMCGCFSPDL
jgi:hypothetical protein